MPQQTVPSLDFGYFVLGEILDLFNAKKIFINENYQRGDIWKERQKVELIQSINERYSIGVLVLFVNEEKQYEVLDGQQRLLSIKSYLTGTLDVSKTEITPYAQLTVKEKTLQDAYCVFYLELKGYDPKTKEEDIVQTFLRLQEGTPLNKAEKISAYRGVFKDTFKNTRNSHPLFKYLGPEKRFRLRQLAAELLLLELDGDFDNKVFPSLDIQSMVNAVKHYQKNIPKAKLQFFIGNLDFMERSLNMLLGAFHYRDVLSFYLLLSYLRKNRAGNQNLINEYAEFARAFLQRLNMFSMYDIDPPSGMTKKEFLTYKRYKEESKIMTTSDSFRSRLEIMISEFERLYPIIEADKKRLYDVDQKRTLFFRQKGVCAECDLSLEFKTASADHVIAHSAGARTDDLGNAQLLHVRCHARVEKRRRKNEQ